MKLSRRTLLTAASAGALAATGAVTAILAPGVRGVFAPRPHPASDRAPRDILVVLFLRFGADGLTMVPPADDADYHANRPTIAIAASGPNGGLPIGTLDGVPFFLHPSIPELKSLYDAGHLAVVHGCGLMTESRSHFISQDKMDRGIADGEAPLQGGWLARHLLARDLVLPGLGAISCVPSVDVSLQGYGGAMAVPDIKLFNVVGGDTNRHIIKSLNTGIEPLTISAAETINTIETVQARLAAMPDKAGDTLGYTSGPLSAALKSLATTIKLDLGLEVATVDYGGWDHHINLNTAFGPQAQELSLAINAFWNDMKDYRDRLTLVTMTEFGRRVKENANGGLDHGSASFMFVLGQHVNGGRIYGQWPGLKAADLHAGDLAVTTDYRRVLQEILVKRRGETALQAVFPNVGYAPLGLIAGDNESITPRAGTDAKI
ncbi:MAG: DUF1501 domain-containing protein [Rhodospirillaceae bacterium]|nr:MAG: DUF1501 domain-containing protein [Rhodospirillaceae bacterium]